VLSFDVRTEGLTISGTAKEVFDRPLVQISAYHAGYGDLIYWGNVALEQGTLTLGGDEHELAPGSLGLYDRTIGHKRTTMNWNYIATAGEAVDPASGATALFAVQGSVDRARTLPQADVKAWAIWIDGAIFKVPTLRFDYTVTDSATATTSDWRVHSASAPGEDGIDLIVKPPAGRDRMYHRRNKSAELWLFERDFNQYYGVASGTITRAGTTWAVKDIYVLLEDAYVVL